VSSAKVDIRRIPSRACPTNNEARLCSSVLDKPELNLAGMTEFGLNDWVVLGLMPETGIANRWYCHLSRAHSHWLTRSELCIVIEDAAAYHARPLPPVLRS
jgi:hypothetical protein